MTDLGKKVDKILTWAFGVILVVAIAMMVIALVQQNQSLKVAAIIIALVICVLSFILDYVLKAIFKETKDTKKKPEVLETEETIEQSENEEQNA